VDWQTGSEREGERGQQDKEGRGRGRGGRDLLGGAFASRATRTGSKLWAGATAGDEEDETGEGEGEGEEEEEGTKGEGSGSEDEPKISSAIRRERDMAWLG